MKGISKNYGLNTILILVILVVLGANSISAQYILNQTTQQTADFNISGSGTANILNATTQFNINGIRVFVANNQNSFSGWYSGFNNTTGSSNAFVGTSSGYFNTTGGNGTFVGFGAGFQNTSGNDNTFFGANTGGSNSIGYSNSFFGAGAGGSNTSGNLNLFAGFHTGFNNSTGNYNSFVGSGTGASNTSGISNTFVGYSTGAGNTTGSNNTLLGTLANVGSANLSYATAIGSGAVVSTSNTILLGRTGGFDKVVIYGLGTAGSTALCRNASNQIATCSSSLRYKTGIAPFLSGLSFINQLQPISFQWKEGGMLDVGFGAEDVARLNPLFVTYNEKGEVEGVKYDRLSVAFVNAFKEQQAQIERQQATIDALKKLVCAPNGNAEICREKK